MLILCASDIHIGRRPFVLSPGITAATSGAAWTRLVDYAIESKVDAVALAGDIVDRENRYFEAIGLLERGLSRLAAAGITTVAIAGNHDCEVLQRVADTLTREQGFILLGRGGKWESFDIQSDKGTVRFIGWSFPSERPALAPLSSFEIPIASDIPTVGLLHGDIDVPDSKYTTLARADLVRHPLSAWVIGHLHQPRRFEATYGRATFYCGALQGLDSLETGEHGAWLLDIDLGQQDDLSFVPLAPLQFETLPVNLEGVADEIAFQKSVFDAINQLAESSAEMHGKRAHPGKPASDIAVQIRLCGRTQVFDDVKSYCKRFTELDQSVIRGDSTYHITRIVDDTAPAFDLEDLARGTDPPAVLARILIGCESNSSDGALSQLLRRTASGLQGVYNHGKFQPLHDSRTFNHPVDDALARELIRTEGYRLLEELMHGRANS